MSFLDVSLIIQKAGGLVRGDRFDKLLKLCDSQKSVSTRKLAVLIEEVMKKERMDGVHFKALADFVRDQTKPK